MIHAKQLEPITPRSAGADPAGLWLYLPKLWDALLAASEILVRHRYCAPWGEAVRVDQGGSITSLGPFSVWRFSRKSRERSV